MDRESLNRALYGSKILVYKTLRRTTYVLTLLAVGLLLYAHGVEKKLEALSLIYQLIDGIMVAFVVIYFLRMLYSFERSKFIRSTWFEGLLMGIILLHVCCTYIFRFPILYFLFEGIGIPLSVELYRVLVSLYMLLLALVELLATRIYLRAVQLRTTTTFLLSFLLLILAGTTLLMLPKMSHSPEGIRFIDALFMAISSSCITGLAVVDVGSYFTFSGQVVILILVQLGGLGMLTFATFIASLMRQGIGIKHQIAVHELVEGESVYTSGSLMRKLLLFTLIIEGLGAVFIYLTWGDEVYFPNIGSKLFFSVFHAVTAFCNAGFSLFPEGLYTPPVQNSYALHLIVASLVIVGGLGVPTIVDVFSPANVRDRIRKPWKKWKTLSRITIYSSTVLLVFGTIVFFLLEYYNTLSGHGLVGGLTTAFFQSVTTRSSGFNTVDISALSVPCLMLFIFLMFIGASPGSTGGGIKTTTFVVILFAVASTIRNRPTIQIGRRTIPHVVAYKAFSVFTFAALANFFFIFILTLTDAQFSVLVLAFEQVSAFSTTGLSTGITAGLSDMGKCVIMLSMYMGRVGTLTLALALSARQMHATYKYPITNVVVG
ncbi:TrkH family potassium uptake protein [Pontibacter sp. SGAir0037]|uniref:TrkH family potassium uptake protein n=1 Tax=Pontibacter sp. SGAir0037 TaxID=2571030 RepID=UPI0010CD5D5A|nr:potassium transporter TrkG [Pontibacter sp. SGAir0037]QCR21406.1 ATPase [Pontibacter sp. SGAir0037]